MLIVLLRHSAPSGGVQGPRWREPTADVGLSFSLPLSTVGRVATAVPSSMPEPALPVALKVGTARTTFAGGAGSDSLMLVALLGAAAVSLRVTSSVARNLRKKPRPNTMMRKSSWYVKRRRYLLNYRNEPKGLIKEKELKQRQLICKLVRRADLKLTRLTLYVDPRDDEYQLPSDEVRTMVENPEYSDPDKLRAKLGLPPPPIDFRKKGLDEMRLNISTRRTQIESQNKEKKYVTKDGREYTPSQGELQREKRAKASRMDLSNLGNEFADFKGIKINKKKKTYTRK